MPGTANGDPKSEFKADGSLAGFETLEALLEVQAFDNPAHGTAPCIGCGIFPDVLYRSALYYKAWSRTVVTS